MPELPEVETVRRDLASTVTGARVRAVSVTGVRSTRRHASGVAFADALAGRTLANFGRWGKYLVVDLEPGPEHLVVHLRMSGQLILAPSAAAPLAKHSHVVLSLADGRELRFVDPRTFGEMFVTGGDIPELAGMGVDALDPSLTVGWLASQLAGRRARLKPLLLDQRFIAGIGNIYSDEILWASRLRWSRTAESVRPVEVRRLHVAIGEVLEAAVAARGSSLGDNQYVDLSGQAGTYQERHQVYGRLGLPCPRCGRPIQRTVVAQRSHFWCRWCQR